MKYIKQVCIICFLLCLPIVSFSTHIVGGSLTYVLNPDGSYTVQLKLYRDCTGISLPNSVDISVLGNNGVAFSPSKDFTMSLISITPVPDGIPACATPPNPLPCVQEGLYTKTINNLPPNFGGYHMYFQIIARNWSIDNLSAACDCIGESFYAFIPGIEPLWNEDFSLNNGTTVDNGATPWSISTPTPASSNAVKNGVFEVSSSNNSEVLWTSGAIDISSISGGVTANVSLMESSTLSNGDKVTVYYSVDGGPTTQFATNGNLVDDFTSAIASQTGIVGNSLVLSVRLISNGGSFFSQDKYSFDNVMVYGDDAFLRNSNPTFTNFPPLFICNGDPIDFDHSAIDLDGDSLVYSFYTPYDGDTGNGAKDPTFSGNTAVFTPVNFLNGYTTNNPLGGAGLTISSTGFLTGTPTALGQYVVGVKVEEYRNGVYIDETLRDFQFNVVTCSDPLAVQIISPNPVICFGNTSTTITAQATGGTPPYNYLWNNVNPSQAIDVGEGTYTVELSDAQNCAPVYATVNVTSYTVPVSAVAGADQTICKQSPSTILNGSVFGPSTGVWSGGTGTYSPNNTALSAIYTPSAAELSAGFVDLTLTTTGSGTCPEGSDVVRINYLDFVGTPTITPVNVSCYGFNDGSATISVAGGSAPHTYFWTNAQTASSISGLAPSTYSVTITDSIGCTAQASTTITEPAPLAVSSNASNLSCGGANDGGIVLTVSNGTSPYSYAWAPSGQTTASLSGLAAGSYTATVTDARGCSLSANDDVTEPTPISISLLGTDITCFNEIDGTVTATISGGTGLLTYAWNSGATSLNLSGVQAGTYSITVTDAMGCTLGSSVSLIQPSQLTATTSSTNISCSGLSDGNATALPSGGTVPYSFLWQSGGQTTASITNINAGTYTVSVRDSSNCLATAFATITEPTAASLSFASQTNVSCFSGSDGAVTANFSGGTPNYSYSWLPGGETTAKISGKPTGTYSVTASDSKGCSISNSVFISEPTLLSVSTTKTDETCNYLDNGTATVAVTGGTSSYSYLWQPGAATTINLSAKAAGTYSVLVTDSKGCFSNATAVISEPTVLSVAITNPNNVSCNGGGDGSATASPSGGTANYSYAWSSGGSTSATATGLTAGSYTVTVTDSQGCTATNAVTITEPTQLFLSMSKIDETCDYLNNGSASIVASGGTTNYSYLWQPGLQTTSTISNLTAGNYSITVTDANGCIKSANTVIQEPAALSISFDGKVDVSCFGESDGAVSSDITGGTANYAYLWSPGSATANSISGLPVGTYTLSITDALGCAVENTVSISEPVVLSVSATKTDVTCFGGSDGTVSGSSLGGTSPYTYTWMAGSNSGQNVSGLTAGTYTVTSTDANGCFANNTVTLTEPSEIVLTTTSVNSDCGQPNGQLSVSVSGGNIPYSYLWSPTGGTNSVATGLISGGYNVMVTDAVGCTSTRQENVNENTAPTVSVIVIKDVTCFGGNDGSVTVGLTGGTGPFTYSWVPAAGTDSIATNLPAGIYTANVVDANGCKSAVTTNPEVTQPSPIEISTVSSSVSCFGGNDGGATVSAIGGDPGYTYQWLPGGTTGTGISNLSASTYSVQVTDSKSCMEIKEFHISEPSAPLSVSMSSAPVSCFGGSDGAASAVASGGTSPYSFSWMPGNFNGNNISNIAIGTYTVTVVDINQCSITNTVTVSGPSLINLNTGSPDSYCSLPNGQANVIATGGTGAYSYLWAPSGGTESTATGLLAGSYTVAVTDENACSVEASVNIVDQPGPIATVISTIDVTCFGGSDGSATGNFTGGTGPFSYSWMPSGNTNLTATGLTAGTYSFTVTDANGCVSNLAVSPPIVQPSEMAITIAKTNVSCFGLSDGDASVTVSGGTPGYTYNWMPSGETATSISNLSAATYTLEVTDIVSCVQSQEFTILEPDVLSASISLVNHVSCFQGNDGAANVSVTGGTEVYDYHWMPIGGNDSTGTGLMANTYTVNITDLNGCTTSANISITQPSIPLSGTGTNGITSCFGGSDGVASVNPAGGTAGYTYLWSPSGKTDQTATGLSGQNYFVLITDSKGCEANATVIVAEPTAVSGALFVVDASCGLPNGLISSQIEGGNSPYTYLWSPNSETTATIQDLAPGTYTLAVADANNCPLNLSTSLVDIPTGVISINATTPVSCFGGMDGSASVNMAQGSPPFTYQWTPSGGNGSSANSLVAGTYTVTSIDSLGCVTDIVLPVAEPAAITISLDSTFNVQCHGESSGSLMVSAAGGTPPYSYLWSPVAGTNAAITDLSAGTYTVNVSDQHACSKSISMVLSEPAVLLSSIGSAVDPICSGLKGNVSVLVSGGTIPYFYSWSTSPPLTGSTEILPADSYTITVSDKNGCLAIDTITVVEPSPVITMAGNNDTVCSGQMATLQATASGGAGGYYFAWQPTGAINNGTITLAPIGDTMLIVVAYDQLGCPGTLDTVSASGFFLAAGDIEALAISPICPGQKSVVSVEASASSGPLTFQWDNGLGSGPGEFIVSPAQDTSYIVTATSAICAVSVSDTVEVLLNAQPTIASAVDTSELCVPGAIQFFDNSLAGNIADPITSWYWDFGDGTYSTEQNPKHQFNQSGAFYVRLTVSTTGGCTTNNATFPIEIDAHPSPVANFSTPVTVLNTPVEAFRPNNLSSGAIFYSWNFGDGGTSSEYNPQYIYSTVGTFQVRLIATSQYDCSDTTFAEIKTNSDFSFPNAFTPSPDGPNGGRYVLGGLTNDVFFPYTTGIIDFKLEVFNRWGELIFESNDVEIGWDGYYEGKLCQQDVYIWKAYMKLNNGDEYNKTGDITLLR